MHCSKLKHANTAVGMNAFHYFLIVARVDLEGLFWQIICSGKNEITKRFSRSGVMRYIMVMHLLFDQLLLSFRWQLTSLILSLAVSACPPGCYCVVLMQISACGMFVLFTCWLTPKDHRNLRGRLSGRS